MGWRNLMGAPAAAEAPYTQYHQNTQNPPEARSFGDYGDIGYMPPCPEPEPDRHCACGSPSWWRAPSSPAWSCAYCEPRDRSRVEAHETLTLHSGRWRSGTAPPVPTPTTVAGLLELHGPLLLAGTVRTADVLEQADPDELAELRDRDVIEGFALALAADRRVRPLPDPALSPLERLAVEIGDDPAELRRWLDQTAAGRRGRAWLERTPGAADRALLALRADPDGPLLLSLDRARAAP